MSFQGDVRGIGLAELLQGLSRGRKEGVLTLTAQGGLRAVLGLAEGKAHLLPDEDEVPEMWRDRVRDAWAEDSEVRVDHLRMFDVARATRLEILYRLLDGEGVHFRFEPGELPATDPALDGGQGLGAGTQIEFLLLEYARIADELEGYGELADMPIDAIPMPLDPSSAPGVPPRFFEQVDGRSTLLELSDRLGWPLRQTKLTLGPCLKHGAVRLLHPDEALGLAIEELRQKRFSRAARRLTSWCRGGTPGPVSPQVAEVLCNEWISGRLTATLHGLRPRHVRTLLRRLDHTLQNPSTSVVHWSEACRIHRTDRLARLRRMAAEFVEASDAERPNVRELLDLARDFRDADHPWRSGPALVMATHRSPENMTQRIELGQGLLQAGRATEAGPWIVAGARELLERGLSDKAVGPLRTLISADPHNREARQLLSRVKRTTSTARKLRKNLLISLGVAAAVGGIAVVKVQRDLAWQERLDSVRARLGEPDAAMAALQDLFGGSMDPEVLTLKGQIEEQQRLGELGLRNDWLERYQKAQVEARKGDPLLALERIREIEDPPRLRIVQGPWPLREDLYLTISDTLTDRLTDLGEVVEGVPGQVEGELEVSASALAVLEALKDHELVKPEVQALREALIEVREHAAQREVERRALARARIERETLASQNEMLTHAQSLVLEGRFKEALDVYEELLAQGEDDRVRSVLEPEIRDVRRQHRALERARELASEGRHGEARTILTTEFEEPDRFSLPWKVTSLPSGIEVEGAGGRLYTTPFVLNSTLGQRTRLSFRAPGYLERRVEVRGPEDVYVPLSRVPDRSWKGDARIDAIPLSVGEDHVLVDRGGRIARVGADGAVRWERSISTLSGVARAPVYVPLRPGRLLLVTEDGTAWMVDAEDGELEGPWELGSAPVVGPTPASDHVQLRLANGRVAIWREGLKPRLEDGRAVAGLLVGDDGYRFGSDCGMQVVRRRQGQVEHFDSRFTGWRVELRDEVYRVSPPASLDQDGLAYAVVREGEWNWMAWEAPTAKVPQGRLWVCDEAGVRAAVPFGG